ncbi:MAG: tRNA (adenosine(37)-N6)-dimethylallyltransferase MiaA [Patescibacteria group bacterium]|nr:tRNA (adenosine(37)-N6)-dimethylallyltransferase MiaA [Patescibacteria group bacterium]MDD5294445.1 tRNA (adenosine(37)-N6)-dimethylallyltransferase MiaA [Patescibacteria group bacterium]MDD5554999.1 tRNA (adenosine(37)-N6)-dimethylallyltransferase MiaA [Patescibacteria group bacterium]
MPINNNKIIVVLGTTASGKTKLGVDLAYKFNGEIISADSRQVYKGMDIGTGKDLNEYEVKSQKSKVKSIPYHLIDVVNPNTKFSLAKYQKLAFKEIDSILKKGKVPIIVGGTGLYLQAVVDNYNLSGAKPDKKLRGNLEKKTVPDLFSELKKINPKFAERLNESERKNKRRLIRYIEIMQDKGVRPPIGGRTPKAGHDFFLLGLTWPKEVLKERIYKRLIERLEKENMAGEVEKLHREGVDWKRLESFGLEYKYISLYLQDKSSHEEMVEKLNIAIRQFAKKQMTWFRRWEKQGREIRWIKDGKEAEKLVREFLK